MMQGFEDVTLTYKGVDYVIPANRVLMAVADVEDAVRGTGQRAALQILLQSGGPPLPRLAMGYAAALKAAGANVSADEIYLAMQEALAQGDAAEVMNGAQSAVMALIAIISPPMAREILKQTGGDEDPGEAQAAD